MGKFSIIIPTLWKSNRTNRLLSDLNECDYVDEIILIDNTLTDITDTTEGKLRKVSYGENIYVNPAWNKGIGLAKNNKIALVNDDINFNPNIFEVITEDILNEFGIIGQSEYNYKGETTNPPVIEKIVNGNRDWGWGCFILFDKKDWIDIPDNIKIWYGDDFIFKYNSANKSILKNFHIDTEMSTTSDESIWNERKREDLVNFQNYLRGA